VILNALGLFFLDHVLGLPPSTTHGFCLTDPRKPKGRNIWLVLKVHCTAGKCVPETFQNPELEFFLSTYWAHSMGITVRNQSHNRKGFPHITYFSSRRTVTLSIVFTFQSPVLHPCLLQTAAHKVLGSVNNFYNRCIWLFGKNYVNKVCLWS
jgi:hypothetical protein